MNYQRENVVQQEQSPSSVVSAIPSDHYISLFIRKKKTSQEFAIFATNERVFFKI